MTHNIVKMRNVGCTDHCAKLCDKAFGEIHYAFAEWEKGGNLHADLRDSVVGVIPLFHTDELYRSLGYNIKKIYLAKFNGEIENSIGDTTVTDISEWKRPKGRNYLIINKRKNVYAGDMLNSYNRLLDTAADNRIKIEFPYDIIVKGASATEINEIRDDLENFEVPHISDEYDIDLGVMQAFLKGPEGQEIIKKIDALPMYHLRQKVRLKSDNGVDYAADE